MKLVVCKGMASWVERAHQWCVESFQDGHRTYYLPAGKTPTPLYEYWEKTRPAFLAQSHLIQIDDVVSSPHHGLFAKFFIEHLPHYQSRFVSGDQYTQGDVAVLGLGLNGHLGFHEPGLPWALYQACVPLCNETCDTLKIPRGSWGVTYGLSAILSTAKVLLLVNGASKRKILRQVLDAKIDVPATRLLKEHPHVVVLADQEAAPNSSP
ncbi:MAG: 6-phosphogluconolactonase [Bdellovibrionales bacterium]|nr:6-phosphogluconolactonase [Bdellovibrionales bacterium]